MRKLSLSLLPVILLLVNACGTSGRMGPRGARNPRSVKNGKNLWYERSGASNAEEIKESLYSESALRGGGANMMLYPGAR